MPYIGNLNLKGLSFLYTPYNTVITIDFRPLFKARFPTLFSIFLITLLNLEYCVNIAELSTEVPYLRWLDRVFV